MDILFSFQMDQFLHMKNMPGGNCPRGSLQMLWGISQQLYSPPQLWCPLWFHLEFKQALKPLSHLWLGTQVSTVRLLRWVNFKFLIVILTEFGINTKPVGIRGKYQFCSPPLQSWPSFLGCFLFSWCTNISAQVHKIVPSFESHSVTENPWDSPKLNLTCALQNWSLFYTEKIISASVFL